MPDQDLVPPLYWHKDNGYNMSTCELLRPGEAPWSLRIQDERLGMVHGKGKLRAGTPVTRKALGFAWTEEAHRHL